MPRYYIDLRGHFGTIEDPSGIELPDVATARTEALKVAGRLLESWAGRRPSYCDEIAIEVVSEEQHPVLTIPYSEFAWLTAMVARA